MEDLEIAKGFISTIIGSEITELYPAPQEATSIALTLKHNQLPLHRMDYVAIIKMGEDKFEKVVVEVQKSPFIPEIERFRNYLAEKYAKISTYKVNDQQIEEHLPIKTIYLLDKKLSDSLPAVLHRKGDYYDVLYQKKYEGEKNKYVELLTHDSWFIQIEKLPPDLKNDLTKILSVFAPWMRDPDQEFYINVDDKELLDKKHALFHRILLRLQNATHNKNLLLALKTESHIEDEIEKYIKQAEKERLQKEAALAKEKGKSIKFAEKMLKYGETIEEIMQETGLTRKEIEEIKKKS